MAVLPASLSPCVLVLLVPSLVGESAAAEDVDAVADAAAPPADVVAATFIVVEGVLTDVITTVTGSVLVTPLETADCVTTDVIMLVVAGSAEAEMIDVTTFVEPGWIVVVVSATDDCDVDKTAADTDEAMEDESSAAMDEVVAAAALEIEDKLVVTVALLSDMLAVRKRWKWKNQCRE
ncbi:hypothetical protein LTR08_006769 [Meristemomyces frigidus]|nr:hypothetical protein LTR08_006769 [Meristemomyces frigidus]